MNDLTNRPPRRRRSPRSHRHPRRAPEQPQEPRPRHPLSELVVVTGVSGSGKSSLVFDTLYAEGQRRYVETFSPYARQFLDRMDKPQVDRIEGIPPAIAIDQTNPVRTSRSTVGTMTELNDHLKLLFARAAQLYCRGCGRAGAARHARVASSPSCSRGAQAAGDPRLLITFPVDGAGELHRGGGARSCSSAGLHAHPRAQQEAGSRWCRTASRSAAPSTARVVEALEAALRDGPGPGERVRRSDDAGATAGTRWRFSSDLHCADCDIHYRDPTPSRVLVQLAARRLRDLPRLRPRDRHRLRPGRSRTSRRRWATARSGRGRRRASTNARTT